MEFITDPYKEKVTLEQYENAKKHWGKLIKGEISGQFDMSTFTHLGAYKDLHTCGTAACSAGYMIETLQIPKGDIIWADSDMAKSAQRNLNYDVEWAGMVQEFFGLSASDNAFEWCFSGNWDEVDNTAKGAGIRMRILYEQGLPTNWQEQLDGADSLIYQSEL